MFTNNGERMSYSHQLELDDEEKAVKELLYVKDEDFHEQRVLRKERKSRGIQLGSVNTHRSNEG